MLRDFLLLIIVAGGFLYGLKLMGMLDGFMEHQHDEKERKEEKKKEYAVIFGSREEAEKYAEEKAKETGNTYLIF